MIFYGNNSIGDDVLMIKDIPTCNRPREKLINYGASVLSNQELLAIILKSGTKNKSVFDLSSEILTEISSIDRLKDYEINWLTKIKGIGNVKACEIIASIELGKRIYLMNNKRDKITCSEDVYNYINYFLEDKKQEYFYCLYLNNKSQVIERRLLFMGTVNRSVVHPREIFKYAYLASASSIICVHNHPSGDIKPSKEDINLTKALVQIGKVQAIPVVDHVIVGCDNYYSMADNLELFL